MEYVLQIGSEFWNTLAEMAPYLLFGFLAAGVISLVATTALVEKHLGGKGFAPVFKASLLGVPLPLCSCGVLPVAASLSRQGSSRGATTAFLLSTPQTGVDSIMVTLSLLGPVFAVFRPAAAFITGLAGGCIADVAGGSAGKNESEPQEQACAGECCSDNHKHGALFRMFYHGFVTLPRDIGRPLLIGLLIAGTISAVVPADTFSQIIGTGISAMFVMMILGVPVYVCATASVPIAAAMIGKGVSPGAALVFLMTGPATNAAAIATIWKVMGRRTAFIYLAVVAVSALVSGIALDYLFSVTSATPEHLHSSLLPQTAKNISAVILLAVLAFSFLKPTFNKGK